MKCSPDRLKSNFQIVLLKFLLIYGMLDYVCVVTGESERGSDMLSDFDYLVSQLYLQHCTFVEIGEGICSLFVELTPDASCSKPRRKQMFFGNCLCSEFRKWHLCGHELTQRRPEDCEFQEGEACASSSARVHRRLCDVTGMSQWNPQCNCSVRLAGVPQENMCGFKTCFANLLADTICGPRTVCGTAHCETNRHGSLYSVRCDRRCRYHQPFCEDPHLASSLRRVVTSQWAAWRPLTSSGGDSDSDCGGDMRQYETECLDNNNEPAFDCLGPGLLCCGKEESDCLCEVKVQDGVMKAFRYMIKFGGDSKQCGSETPSKLKIRSVGLKGDAKVWDRFIGSALKKDNKNESVSMFGKPVGFEEYLKKTRPEEYGEIIRNNMRASLQDQRPKEGILQQLVMLVSNRSQVAGKSNEKLKGEDGKTLNDNSLKGVSGNDKNKLSGNPQQTLVNQTVHSSLNDGLDHSFKNLVQIISNNSESSLNQSVQNQLKDVQPLSEKSEGKSMSVNHQNSSNMTEIPNQNSGDGQVIMAIVGNLSQTLNKPAMDGKDTKAHSGIDVNVNANNSNTGKQTGSEAKPVQNNQGNQQSIINGNKTINSGVKNGDTVKTVTNQNQNIAPEMGKNATSSSEKSKDIIQSLILFLEKNAGNKREKSGSTVNENDNSENNIEGDSQIEQQQFLMEQGEVDKKDDSQDSEVAALEKIIQGNENENQNVDSDYSTERADLHEDIGEEDKSGANNEIDSQKNKDADSEDEKETNTDLLEEKKPQNSGEREANNQESLLGAIQESEVQLKGNENQQGMVSAQEKQANNSKSVIERTVSDSSKGKVVSSNIATGSSFQPTASLMQTKQVIASNLSDSVKLTTVAFHENKASYISKVSVKKTTAEDSQNKVQDGAMKSVTSPQNINITNVNSNTNKEQFTQQPALDKTAKLNDIGSIFPNNPGVINPKLMSTKPRPKPDFLQDGKANEVKQNIETLSTPHLLGAIARKLFKSHFKANLNDPLSSLSEEKPSHDYDEPEPVLKDLNKVDKDNVDEKTAEALSKLANLPVTVDWSEKAEDNRNNLGLGREKKPVEKESVKHVEHRPTPNIKKKRFKSKLMNN